MFRAEAARSFRRRRRAPRRSHVVRRRGACVHRVRRARRCASCRHRRLPRSRSASCCGDASRAEDRLVAAAHLRDDVHRAAQRRRVAVGSRMPSPKLASARRCARMRRGAVLSQGISNVPAAIMLAEFSKDWRALAFGVSVGGFGIAIGSLANLIAVRLVRREGHVDAVSHRVDPILDRGNGIGWRARLSAQPKASASPIDELVANARKSHFMRLDF